MTIHVNIGKAKDRFSELVAAAERGEKVVIARAGKPVVDMVASKASTDARGEQWRAWFGSFAGMMPSTAGDLFLEPTFTDEEMESFGLFPDEKPRRD